jgi:hypothetical protein
MPKKIDQKFDRNQQYLPMETFLPPEPLIKIVQINVIHLLTKFRNKIQILKITVIRNVQKSVEAHGWETLHWTVWIAPFAVECSISMLKY